MAKPVVFSKEYINSLTMHEAFNIAKLALTNATRLHQAAILLFKNEYFEQAYNNLFIACEEYFKAKTFDAISYVKLKNEELSESVLDEFVKKSGNHEWKFEEAFFDAEINIPNVSLNAKDGIDDTEIQANLHREMEETFDFLKKMNPYHKKNNSLYIGWNSARKKIIIPQEEISKEMVEKFFNICFYVQLNCHVTERSQAPSGEMSSYLKWSGKSLTDLIVKK